jgi:hypothetical protein
VLDFLVVAAAPPIVDDGALIQPTLGHYLNGSDAAGSGMIAAPCSRGSVAPVKEPVMREAAGTGPSGKLLSADNCEVFLEALFHIDDCVVFVGAVCRLVAHAILLLLHV